MRRFSLIIIALCAGFVLTRACPAPTNIEGVAFTSGERIDLQKLMLMGVENVNYLRDNEATNIGIRYKSHYDPSAMVFIGNYGLSYQEGMSMNCMGVVLPLPDSVNELAPISKETFNFAAAVKKELEWLVYFGIIGLSYEKVVKIDSVLSIATNGGMQFWTHANRPLAYNSWFGYDSVSGKWIEEGVNGVRGVYGVDGVKGCSVVNPGNGMPSAGLGTTAAAPRMHVAGNRRVLAVRQLGDGGLIVFLPQAKSLSAVLTIFNFKGAVVRTIRAPAGVQSMYINGLARGHYTVRLQN